MRRLHRVSGITLALLMLSCACGGEAPPEAENGPPPPPPPPPPPSEGTVNLTSGQTWTGTADQVCISLTGACGGTQPANTVTVRGFVVDGTGLNQWSIGNNGLIFVQGGQNGVSDILIENGVVRNCPADNTDPEHHAAITVKRADGQVTIRNVEAYNCPAAVYFKYEGSGPILIEDSYFHDVWWGGRVRSYGVTYRNTVLVGAGPQYQIGTGLVIEHSTLVNSPVGWPDDGVLRNSVVLGSAGNPPVDDENCYLTGNANDHFADPDNGDYTLIGDAATQCAGKGAD